MSIGELFRRVKDNPSGHAYTATKIEGRDNVYLAVNLAGQPCLLVRVETWSAEPPLRTAKVSFRPRQEFSLSIDGETSTRGVFHILACESSDNAEVENFLLLLDAFLARHSGHAIGGDSLASFFRSMVRLFTVTPARDLGTERQGLWGELFFMRQFRGYALWAPYWHNESTRLFDFSSSHHRVEVKTAIGDQRVHHFSHRQIYALEGEEIVIASLLVREEDAGLTLQELVDECRLALRGTEYFLKLERAVRRAGMDDPSISGPSYDATQSAISLALFRSTEAPHFRMPEPPGVSETHYKVDLSTAPRLAPEDIESLLRTWLSPAMIPRV